MNSEKFYPRANQAEQIYLFRCTLVGAVRWSNSISSAANSRQYENGTVLIVPPIFAKSFTFDIWFEHWITEHANKSINSSNDWDHLDHYVFYPCDWWIIHRGINYKKLRLTGICKGKYWQNFENAAFSSLSRDWDFVQGVPYHSVTLGPGLNRIRVWHFAMY